MYCYVLAATGWYTKMHGNCFLVAQLWILIVTAIYFVPKIQMPLDTTYSPTIIQNLLSNEIPLRSSAVLLVFFVTGGMLLKVGEEILKKK